MLIDSIYYIKSMSIYVDILDMDDHLWSPSQLPKSSTDITTL